MSIDEKRTQIGVLFKKWLMLYTFTINNGDSRKENEKRNERIKEKKKKKKMKRK